MSKSQAAIFWARHGHNVMTVAAAAGATATVVLGSKAAITATNQVRDWQFENDIYELEFKEHWWDLVKVTWKTYLPTAVALTGTIASIIAIRNIGASNAAMYANMASAANATFEAYSKKVVEKIGEEQEREVRQEVAKDQVAENPPPSTLVVSGDEVIFMDSYSGRYFKDTVENIRSYVNEINKQVLDDMFASLDDLYELYGLEPTADSHAIGWNADRLLEVDFVLAEAPGMKPCFRLDYQPSPVMGYDRFA